MKIFIALIRGINVGGHKKFIKTEQLEMLQDLGFSDPQIYLHTGNWIFVSEDTTAAISKKIETAINTKYGWEVPVLVLKASEIRDIFNGCPFSEDIKEKSYFTLLDSKPSPDNITVLKTYNFPGEEYYIVDRCIYFYPIHGAGKSKMSNNFFESKLKVTATSRNYRTMTKLVALATSI